MNAATAEERKNQRQSAEAIYRAQMTDLARTRHELPRLSGVTQTFQVFSVWYESQVVPRHRGKARELEILKPLRRHFGALDLTEITRATVHDYAAVRMDTDKRKPRTVNREVALLKSILKAAVEAGHLKASPLAGMPELRAAKIAKRVLTAEEESRLLAELRPADQALYIVAVDTLVRLSNVLNLTRAEDKGTYLALTDSKTGPYVVPISSRARAALDSLPDTGPYYFPHRRRATADRDRRGAIRTMLKRACGRCEPPIPYGRAAAGVTFHTATRATGATRMLRANVDPKTVQAIGNWSSFEQMGEYLQAEGMMARAAAVNQIAPPAATPPLRSPKPKQKRAKKFRKTG